MSERPYENLIAWKESHALCLLIYKETEKFPSSERFQLVSQMRRSAYGIPMNLAEGNSRRSGNDKARFFEIALGSLEELHYQCRLARDLLYMSQQIFEELQKQVHRVSFLITKLRAAVRNP